MSEYERFKGIANRTLCMPGQACCPPARVSWSGARILVTGGTGCIGSTLMPQLALYGPERLVSFSRDSLGYPATPGAEYVWGDVRDQRRVGSLIKDIRPDIIFHAAAQRDPGLAEVEVHRTVTTNVFGTRNVLRAAGDHHVPQVVLASTGKAMRPYSPDTYTASKRVAEWLGVLAASAGLRVSAARFTHVIDNSIILRKLRAWARADAKIRLHSADIAFYVQSALESAQLLVVAGQGVSDKEFRIHAIRDLGCPVSLTAVAEGVKAELGSASPICVTGYVQGYEEKAYPGLYDTVSAGDVSPLINIFEASSVTSSPCPMVDAFPLQMTANWRSRRQLVALERLCDVDVSPSDSRCAQTVRQELNTLSWLLLGDTLEQAPPAALKRSAMFTEPHYDDLSPDYRRLLDEIKNAS